MLTLQRASAGSGKTYTLTRKYLTMLLTVQDPGATQRRLRTESEIMDGVARILAVTFTNKATNEMKERILSKLNALAFPPADPKEWKNVDYLNEFLKEYNIGIEEFSLLCKYALREILYQYSEFNISTIDAFFQTILRTFAYESDLPDSYNLVIDAKYLAQNAVRDLVDDLASNRLPREEYYWMLKMLREKAETGENSWTVFQRKSGNRYSLYSTLIGMGEGLEKEEFKGVKKDIEEFYEEGKSLQDAYRQIQKQLGEQLAERLVELREAATQVIDIFTEIAADGATKLSKKLRETPGLEWTKIIYNASRTSSKIKALLADDADPWKLEGVPMPKEPEKVFASGVTPLPDLAEAAMAAVAELMEAQKEYLDVMASEEVQFWLLVIPGLPRISVMNTLRNRIADYLRDNDAMQLADANTILRKIISDDDVPFIYERIGTRINHYLIDEFQDTSLMQWENFRPLLSESLSKGNENLIIGDAKQSIYRFRSAEPKLITSIVPQTFGSSQIIERGYSEADNTNWRSAGNIVRFNNFFFHTLARVLDDYNADWTMPKLAELYSNVVQRPKNSADTGYVRIECVDKIVQTAESEVEVDLKDGDKISAATIEKTGDLIRSLLERGWRQRDIAILVNRRAAGADIITGLMDYNLNYADRMPLLKFVSEESLKLSRSRAVGIVVECFRMIQSGIEEEREEKEAVDTLNSEKVESAGSSKKPRLNWAEIGHKFSFYSTMHREQTLEERLKGFLKEGIGYEDLDALIAEMQAVTLPSLMEMLTETFVPLPLRKEDAPFLAAFQDAVLDYCEVNPADIGSFLKWWDRKGSDICIVSPEGTEAISVMTVHASKGLEFQCVILPDINLRFAMRDEWIWMETPGNLTYAPLLPASVPMEVKKSTADKTLYAPYIEAFENLQYMHEVDQLNKAYVAFTRAVSELYIFMPPISSRGAADYLNTMTSDILEGYQETLQQIQHLEGSGERGSTEEGTESGYMPSAGDIRHSDSFGNPIDDSREEGGAVDASAADSQAEAKKGKEEKDPNWGIFEYGEPIKDVEALLTSKKSENKRESLDINDYFVNSSREILKYHPEGQEPTADPADDDRMDPRSEGSLLHAVLEDIIKESDLEMAFERKRVKGMMTRAMINDYKPMLKKALESVRERGWYGGGMRVLTERPVFKREDVNRRPDRVMIDDAGHCIVVDYKFGDRSNRKAHHQQVRNYMELMKGSGQCSSVEGYVWYVKEGKIEQVDSEKPGKD